MTTRRRSQSRLILAVVIGGLLVACSSKETTSQPNVLKVSGSTTVAPVVSDAAVQLRASGLNITIDTQGGSAGGIGQLAAGQIDVAMTSKPVSEAERGAHPSVNFHTVELGRDGVGVVVRREVLDGGVRRINREDARAVFEGRVRNWSELGGPSIPVFVFDKEPGRGTREVLDKWLYGDTPPPPPPTNDRYAVVGGNEETRTKLLSTPGSVAPLSVAFASGHPQLAAVALDGTEPTNANIRSGRYPLVRALNLVTNGPPRGGARTLVDYLLSDPGQEIVRRHGYLALSDLNQP